MNRDPRYISHKEKVLDNKAKRGVEPQPSIHHLVVQSIIATAKSSTMQELYERTSDNTRNGVKPFYLDELRLRNKMNEPGSRGKY